MRIGIFFDTFLQGGGAEKALSILAKHLKADIITSGYNSELYKDWKVNPIDLGNFTYKFNNRIGFAETGAWFYFNRKRFDYDLNIFGGIFSIFAAEGNSPNIWYCFSPNRTLYDLRRKRMNESNFLGKKIINIYSNFLIPRDQRAVKKHIEKIFCISNNTQERVRRFYGLESGVIYPPIETEKYRFKEFGDYFFTVSRLIPEKRVDLIARAFTEMPEKKLVIAGYGPEEKNIKKIIQGHKNIEFIGRINEKELIDHYANCLATVYMPVDEDFGMIALEGNASGKPCIAVNDGGCREAVRNKKTGFLIEPKEEEIIKTVNNLSEEKAERMKKDCINWSKEFDVRKYLQRWDEEIKKKIG
ncbi:MAG: glycosyltransferase [archaeon]|nr:glycosyltransferase [Candidatus Micrarchaeota archaeon]